MALTKNDLELLQEMFTAQDTHFSAALAQQSQDIKRDIRDEMDARLLASETKMERLFRHELQAVIDLLLTFVPERFEKVEHDMIRVKTHIGLA